MPAEQNKHTGKTRLNNPPIGLVDENEAVGTMKKTYEYDPHLDPSLQWAGKTERTSFEVPTVSLHTHERIDPKQVMQAVRKKGLGVQGDLFAPPDLPLGDALEFYKHAQNWENRLVAGDSLLVMNSLLEKEGMAGAVQMIYFDPPYGIKYQSNFQPFTDKRDVKDGSDNDLSSEPEMIKAFRDTWQLGIHSYLTYLRDRLLLAHELLAESGSVFVQISDENVHRVRCLLDEIFGGENFVALINYRSMTALGQRGLAQVYDYVVWYSKSKSSLKFKPIFIDKSLEEEPEYCFLDEGNGNYRKLNRDEIYKLTSDEKKRIFKRSDLASSGYTPSCTFEFQFDGKIVKPKSGKSWRTNSNGVETLIKKHRLFNLGDRTYFRQFHSDFPFMQLENSWFDTAAGFSDQKVYVVQSHTKIIQRCLMMTTSPGDLVLDITCGSGTTAYVAEQWGRRWITCDTSRVAITLAKQRLMTAVFPYYQLKSEQEGVSGDFRYDGVPHITLKSIANNEPAPMETLYDKPKVDKKRVRACSPFTVEAVPSAVAASPDVTAFELTEGATPAAANGATPATTRLESLLDELMTKGVRGKSGQRLYLTNLELLATSAGGSDLNLSHVQARAEVKTENGEAGGMVAIVLGNEYTPMDKSWVDKAMGQAFVLRPKVQQVLFLAYQFDAGVHEYVEKSGWGGLEILLAQIDTDLLVEDLKKKQKGDSFWLIGQPDVKLKKTDDGKYVITVNGFDYYNVAKQEIESGGKGDIAMWLLDTDYNDRFLRPDQIFFPMSSGNKDGWSQLAKVLSAEIDPELVEAYRGTESLPFELGPHGQIAVKVIDNRGVESMRILRPS